MRNGHPSDPSQHVAYRAAASADMRKHTASLAAQRKALGQPSLREKNIEKRRQSQLPDKRVRRYAPDFYKARRAARVAARSEK